MSLNVAIQMDPIHRINVKSDSTYLLALEAMRRGHRLFYYEPRHMFLQNGVLKTYGMPLEVFPDPANYFRLGEEALVELASFEVILMRQDPPFDMNYLTATYLLERIHPKTLVVNNPAEVRNCPEKLLITHFPNLMPATLITQDERAIKAFRDEYKDIVVKPLYAHGGRDVFHVKPGDDNLSAIIEMFAKLYPHPLIVQQYLPEIRSRGDKRIILIEGEPMGTLTRIPAEGQVRSNLVAGGTAVATTITEHDRKMCAVIGPELKKRGLIFAGIDVIGDYITEINVTSPTGLPSVNRLCGVQLEATIWDAIEKRLS